MSKERDIFLQVLELHGETRDNYLADLESVDPQLCGRIRRLLEASEEDEFLNESPLRSPFQKTLGPETPVGTPQDILAGKVRLGDFQLETEIAVGGIGRIYRARQVSLNRQVALKVLRSGQLASAAEIQRFRAEAEAVASLDHPHIIPVYEVGEEAGHHFFSMKLINGPNLAEALSDYTDSPREAVELLVKVIRAVHHANQRGVLHRDLKPSNILLENGITPFVADFGIAKRLDLSRGQTREGMIMGTPAYMAPEQVSSSVGRVTARTDVYGLGCILYELLTGQTPLETDSIPEAFRNILTRVPKRPGALREGVPRDLETICMKCLNKEPWARYDSAAELADDLERWLTHQPIQARQAGFSERMVLLWQRKPVVTTLAAVVVFLVFILAVGASLASLQLRRHLERAIEAETSANERLRASLLAQASATRRTGLAGRQTNSLELLRQAAAISKGPDLRNEALAVLALTDLEVEQEWELGKQEFTIYAFSATTEQYAKGFHDGRIEIHNFPPHDQQVHTISGFGDPTWLARFSHDGHLLLAKYQPARGSSHPATVLWDLDRGSMIWKDSREIAGSAVEFHPSEPQMLIGLDKKLLVVDTQAGRTVRTLDLPGKATAIDFHPDGRLLAVAFLDLRRTVVYQLPDFRPVRVLEADSQVSDVAWSHDGELLATVYYNKQGEIWEFSSGRRLSTLRGHQGEIVYAQFLSTGPVLETYSWDETTRLWDPYSGEELLVSDRRGYRFSEDGKRLFFLTSETAGFWRVHHGEILRKAYGHRDKDPRSVRVSRDGKIFASLGTKGAIVWNAENLLRMAVLDDDFNVIDFSPIEDAYYTCQSEGLKKIPYQVVDGRFLPQPEILLTPIPCQYAAIDREETLAVSFTYEAKDLQVIDLQTGKSVQLGLHWPRERLQLSPDSRLAASGNWRGSGIRVWDLENNKVLMDLTPEINAARAAFSPSGEWLLASTNREYRLWNTREWTSPAAYLRPLDYSNLPGRADFSADGRFLAVAKSERLITLLTVPDLQSIAELEPPGYQEFTDLRFSPDGSRIYASTSGNHIQIWDLAAAQEKLRALELEDGGSLFLLSENAQEIAGQ